MTGPPRRARTTRRSGTSARYQVLHRISRHNKIKVLVAMSFAVTFASVGDIMLSHGVKTVCADDHRVFHIVLAALTNFYFVGGVLLLISFFILYAMSLSWGELSYVLPLTAGEYLLVTILAYFLLGENVLSLRWAGSGLVAAGIAVVTRT